jgi:Ser/Thr protein kinase RdoA (MazF antagonist)
MGIIVRMYHRSEGLTPNRFNAFFMDMGENIHLHYRDIRIEFSVDEFLEFAELCEVYFPQVRKEIQDGYRDGVNPNTNQADTVKTFYTKKPLKTPLTYNPTRISLEENSDGFHVHLRNYKFLVDKESFLNLARAAGEVMDIRETPVDLRETLSLISANELEHTVEQLGEDGTTARVAIAAAYYRKLLQLLQALGFEKLSDAPETHTKDGARLEIRTLAAKPRPAPKKIMPPSTVVSLTDYLASNAKNFSAAEINLLKLQVLDVYERCRLDPGIRGVELDHRKVLFDTASGKVVFPATTATAPLDPAAEWSAFDRFLSKHGLGFVKPVKLAYGEANLRRLDASFRRYLLERVIMHPCVSRLWLLNPIEWKKTRSRTGRYEVPFLHIAWSKLGSDFDILIELDERHPVPEAWEYKFFWNVCGCDYYHLGEVDFPIDNPFAAEFPNIRFKHHLVEAYIFRPSKMESGVKDAYLQSFTARELVYEKKAVAEGIPSFVEEKYGLHLSGLETLKTGGYNEVLRGTAGDRAYVIKVMKGAEFTPRAAGESVSHAAYEADLMNALAGASAPAVVPVAALDGKRSQHFGQFDVVVMEHVDAASASEPTADMLASVAGGLARIHRALPADASVTKAYTFRESAAYWLRDLRDLAARYTQDAGLLTSFDTIIPAAAGARSRIEASGELMWVHCHGDVTPRNVMFVNDQAVFCDFQAAHFGPRIADIAEGAIEFAFSEATGAIDHERIRAFIRDYEREQPLSPPERVLLQDMLTLHVAIKLGRLLRMQVQLRTKVSSRIIEALLSFGSSLVSEA